MAEESARAQQQQHQHAQQEAESTSSHHEFPHITDAPLTSMEAESAHTRQQQEAPQLNSSFAYVTDAEAPQLHSSFAHVNMNMTDAEREEAYDFATTELKASVTGETDEELDWVRVFHA